MSADGDHPCYPDFLTEKVLKPLYLGHPFLLLCAGARAWDILTHFGFKDYRPTIPTNLTDTSYVDFPCDNDGPTSGKYAPEVVSAIRRLQDMPNAAWGPALATAAHNKRHLICPDGFGARLRAAERAPLDLAARLVGTVSGYVRARRPADVSLDDDTSRDADLPRISQGSPKDLPRKQKTPVAAPVSHAPSVTEETHSATPTDDSPADQPQMPTGQCGHQCTMPCETLFGNLERECGGCGATSPCRPGQPGYDNWRERAAQWEAAHPDHVRYRNLP